MGCAMPLRALPLLSRAHSSLSSALWAWEVGQMGGTGRKKAPLNENHLERLDSGSLISAS